MIIKEQGKCICTDRVGYYIGGTVITTADAPHPGLIGKLIEVRDGEDKITSEKGQEFLCHLSPSILPHEADVPNEEYSVLSSKMVEPITLSRQVMYAVPLYELREAWVINGKNGVREYLFAYSQDARLKLRLLAQERRIAWFDAWRNEPDFEEDSTDISYTCSISGDHVNNHYTIGIAKREVELSQRIVSQIGSIDRELAAKEDLETAFTDNEAFGDVTDAELEQIFMTDHVRARINAQLGDPYRHLYWAAVDEVANEFLADVRDKEAQ